MLTISYFNPRQTLSAMLASNGIDTKFIGEITGSNKDAVQSTSTGAMILKQGDTVTLNGVESYPLYVTNTVSDSGPLHYLSNQINRVFYFGANGALHSHIRYKETWTSSPDNWIVAIDPTALSLPDIEFEADITNPDRVLFTSMVCFYKTHDSTFANNLLNIDDIAVANTALQPILANRIQMRIMGSTITNEFRLLYDVFSENFNSGNTPYTRWTFYIDAIGNCFTRIIMEDAVLSGLDPITLRTDVLDAAKSDVISRTKPTTIDLSIQPGPTTVGKYVRLVAKLMSNGELLREAGGEVTFFEGNTEIGTEPVSIGMAKINRIWNTVGTYDITCKYTGDGVTGEAVYSQPLSVEIF